MTGRITSGAAVAALPLASALTAATQGWWWLVWASIALLALSLVWTFAPWVPRLRDVLPSVRRVRQLEAFWVEGREHERVRVASDADLVLWISRLNTWSRTVESWLGANLSRVEAERFRRPDVHQLEVERSFNAEHNKGRLIVRARLRYLSELRDAELP